MLGFRRLPFDTPAAPPEFAAPVAPDTALGLDHRQIPDVGLFEAISVPAGDLVANGRLAKFLLDLRSGSPEVHFINGNFTRDGQVPDSARYHWSFAQEAVGAPEDLAEFNGITYFTQPKSRYVAGVLHTYLLEGSPNPVYGLQFYPQDVIREDDILTAVVATKAAVTIEGARFAFVATGQQQTVATVGEKLAAAGIEVIPIDQILGSITFLPMNLGEAWGYLRIFPESNDELSPADIPVFDELPLDLSVVAGVMTKTVQDANSHVNLKSKERGTPNMVLRNAGPDNALLSPWADKPVHLTVSRDGFTLEASSEQEVAAKLAERDNRPWVPLQWDQETTLRTYDEMAAGDAAGALGMSSRYGGKAANIGFLVHKDALGRAGEPGTPSADLGYDLVPEGFGIPLTFYRRLVEHPPNAFLRAKLKALTAAERAGVLSPAERRMLSEEVQGLFMASRFPDEDLAAIRSKFADALKGVEKVKVRSSANAEDIPNFDGAGLHDSYSSTVEKKDNPDWSCKVEEEEDGNEVKRKVKPKSVACAVKGVYASLWNKRAIEERSFARIDHATVAMGSAVVPAYDNESPVAANAVVITRVVNATGVYGFSLSLQQGNNLVTNPDPGTWSEVSVAAIGLGNEPTSITITRFAKPTRDGAVLTEPVLDREKTLQLVGIAMAVEKGYCAADPTYYPGNCEFVVVDGDKPKSLDMEFKLLENGQFVCKQVREFAGR